MAKKKANVEGEEVKSGNFNYEDFIITGKTLVERKRDILSISPAIDRALGGGVPEGTIMVICGAEKIGKSVTAIQIGMEAQKKEHGSRKVFFLNIEERIDKKRLEGTVGLNLDEFFIVGSKEGAILTAEMYLETAERVLIQYPGCVVIMDSLSALVSGSEYSKKYGEAVVDQTGKLQSRFFRKIAPIIRTNRNILICITQLYANVSGYGTKVFERTSSSLKYYHSIKLRCDTDAASCKPWEYEDKEIGKIVTWTAVESDLAAPGNIIQSFIRYNHGIDKAREIVDIGVDLGVIAKSGSWFVLKYKDEEIKVQGVDNMWQYLVGNPEVLAHVEKAIQ